MNRPKKHYKIFSFNEGDLVKSSARDEKDNRGIIVGVSKRLITDTFLIKWIFSAKLEEAFPQWLILESKCESGKKLDISLEEEEIFYESDDNIEEKRKNILLNALGIFKKKNDGTIKYRTPMNENKKDAIILCTTIICLLFLFVSMTFMISECNKVTTKEDNEAIISCIKMTQKPLECNLMIERNK